MFIDTHAHLNFNAFKNDADEVIKRSLDAGVWMLNVGSQYETSKRAVEIAEKYPQGVYAAVGLHPIHLETKLVKIKNDPDELPSATNGASADEVEIKTREEEFDPSTSLRVNYEKYKKLALRSLGEGGKVVAIGEIGLDYYYRPKTKARLEEFKNRQKEVLIKQMELAKELNLPIIFHCRSAHDDLIEILALYVTRYKLRGVIHCFTGTLEQMKKYVAMGFYIGLNGIIFKLDLDNIIKEIPLDKILLETDCPYLTPSPIAGRNEPIYVKYVAEKVAQLKGLPIDKLAEITTQNAKELFGV